MTNQSLQTSLSRAVFCGAVGGGLAGALDLFCATRRLGPFESLLQLSVLSVSNLALFGALLAAGFIAARHFGGQIFKGRPSAKTWSATALATPWLVLVAGRLFQGGLTSRLPLRWVWAAAVAAAAVSVFFASVRICENLVRRLDQRKDPALRAVVVLGLLSLGAAAHLADVHLYRRLYLYLHETLGIFSVGVFATAVRMGLPSPRGEVFKNAMPRALSWLLVAAAAVGTANSHAGGLSQTARGAVYEAMGPSASLLRRTARFSVKREVRSRPPEKKRVEPAPPPAERRGGEGHAPGGHILLVTIDALRADMLGTYGNRDRDLTPQIDEWATGRGVVFERAYCPAPHSSYSMTSLMTGRHIYDEATQGDVADHPTLASALGGAGYRTLGIYTEGIFFTEGEKVDNYRRSKLGFSKTIHGAYDAEEMTDRVLAQVEALSQEGAPLFVWAHYFNVHEPYRSTRFGEAPADRYQGEVAEADRAVGRLLTSARRILGDSLVVVLTADHGEEFKEHGGYYHGSSLYDEQVRVPLIIATPKTSPSRAAGPVSSVWLAPTLLRLVGVEVPLSMSSSTLVEALEAPGSWSPPLPVFGSVMRHHMVVEKNLKLIAEPTLNLYELYDLNSDPGERVNLFDTRPAEGERLLGLLHGWLDEVARHEDADQRALGLARMHDPRAVQPLRRMLADESGAPERRAEAVELLQELAGQEAKDELGLLLSDPSKRVAVAAAVALGRLGDDDGLELLYDTVFSHPSPSVRDEAAFALARLNDDFALEQLVEALGRTDHAVREQAVRMLGRLQNPAASRPLIDMLDEYRVRYLVVLALGKIGGPDAYDALMNVLDEEQRTDVRGYAVVGLGWIRDERAASRLVDILKKEPEIPWTAEALVRLDGVGKAPVWGIDASSENRGSIEGAWTCETKPFIVEGEFLGRTTCTTRGRTATVSFEARAEAGGELIVRVGHVGVQGQEEAVGLRVAFDGRRVAEAALGCEPQQLRIELGPAPIHPGRHTVTLSLEKRGRLIIDHVLLLAR